MKTRLVVLVLSATLLMDRVFASEVDDFVANVDTNWAAQNFTGMQQTINDRLSAHTNDLPALLFKMNYYLMIDYQLTNAQSFLTTFTNTVVSLDWSPDPEAKALCEEMAGEVINPTQAVASGVIFGFTSNQLDQVHTESPSAHPLSSFVSRVAAIQYP